MPKSIPIDLTLGYKAALMQLVFCAVRHSIDPEKVAEDFLRTYDDAVETLAGEIKGAPRHHFLPTR